MKDTGKFITWECKCENTECLIGNTGVILQTTKTGTKDFFFPLMPIELLEDKPCQYIPELQKGVTPKKQVRNKPF